MFKIEKSNEELVKRTKALRIDDLVKISSTDGTNKFCMMPKQFVNQDLDRIKKMEIFEDDVWVVTFPKCGTTWTQEMIWMLNNNLDYEKGKSAILDERFPFVEFSGICINFPYDTFELIVNSPRPRHIKSHLPLFLLPDQLWTVKPKIVYVVRNPKDTAVSYFHHHRGLHLYKGNKNDFIQAFVKDLVIWSPFNDHVLDFWKISNEANILFLFYEDMKRNLESEVKKAMKFLGKNYSQEEIEKLCKHLSFESLQKNDMVNKKEFVEMAKLADGPDYKDFSFIRKGQVGGYKQELTNEENEMLDDYSLDPKLAGAGFEYKFS